MKKTILTLVTLTFIGLSTASAQVGIGTSTPDSSAALELESTDKGFLPPRMTTAERDSLLNPPEGLVIYNTDNIELEVAGDGEWINLTTNERTTFSSSGSVPSSQGSFGIGTTSPSDYAILDITSTDKGFLPPRMNTSQRDAISNPAEGLTIYNTDRNCLQSFKGLGWRNHCTPIGPTDAYNPRTGQVWMDRNLGASQVATSSTDAASYGDLYQWGRAADGHEDRNSSTTSGPVAAGNEGGDFITASSDWLSTPDDDRWNANETSGGSVVKTVNDPCPSGYRIPTEAEWNAERLSWAPNNNAAGAFASPLKLPSAGARNNDRGTLRSVGLGGVYWSSTVSGTLALRLGFGSSDSAMADFRRAFGLSVRCIKD